MISDPAPPTTGRSNPPGDTGGNPMPHVDETKRMKLFGDLTSLMERRDNFVDRRGRRVGDDDTAQEYEAASEHNASTTAPPRNFTATAPPDDATELCHACPANGSCPSFCRTCGGGREIIAPCPLGRW